MNNIINIAIIGGGASGLFLASQLQNREVTIIDNNPKLASKIAISGGGRCNITNKILSPNNYLGDKRFIQRVLKRFNNRDLIEWLNQRGLTPTIKNETQYFCAKSSSEIINIFLREIKKHHIIRNQTITSIIKKDDIFYIQTNRDIIKAQKVVIASGGLSFAKIGATSIGFEIASHFGHTINKPSPALVGFTLQKEQSFLKSLSGVSLVVSVKVENKIFNGSLLFTHRGISGPVILNSSLYWQKGSIEIDFLDGFEISTNSNKLISSYLPIPKRVIKTFLDEWNIEDKPMKKLSHNELKTIKSLSSYSFAPAGNFGYNKAEVTRGGVATNEINAKTMQSKLVKDLYFIGEVLDVTGELGGYNFQWAFSSAYNCGINF
ncbi:NAD(FAD)-utilizing dehydrogenases [hydrothermal vent metagenome]|uniref:NAD(FAD)-utilizing dehydrogenases n=1 Tax=hydrothermal vent metagenome TaxID=652676 RepID=A0A1W1EKL6_9ZZZZ